MPAPLRQICNVIFCKLRFTPETAIQYLTKNELNSTNMYMTEKTYVFQHKPLVYFKPNSFCHITTEPGIWLNYGSVKR